MTDLNAAYADALRRISALEAELSDAKELIAKRAKVRVSVHDTWVRERERREKAEAERDAICVDLKACAEALQAAYRTLNMHLRSDYASLKCGKALDIPGVRAVLERTCSPA